MTTYTSTMMGFSVAAGLFSFIMNYSHFLNSLLSLEFLALSVYWWLSLSLFSIHSDFLLVLFYLCVSVCEGVLGLSLLISSVYSHGSDYMKGYNFLSC
uniref:NADH-ubiquinone oxidoreductase chain 4L n=1 Tax=Linevichella vortex TaxID=686705 RepID=A0A1L5BWA4_9CRUS|nr:NADH dehydrogenase subunit 4L [Linevichella vortex]